MARHGENIRKRKDGRWEGRYLVYSEEKKEKRFIVLYMEKHMKRCVKNLRLKKIFFGGFRGKKVQTQCIRHKYVQKILY